MFYIARKILLVIRYEGMDYSPKIEVCYINGELHTLDVYKSDGILSYTIEELKTDRVLTKYLGIPLKRTIIIQMDSIFDNGIVFACKNRGDSIIVNNDNEIIIYYKIGMTVFDSFQGKWQKKRAVLSFRDSKNRTFA